MIFYRKSEASAAHPAGHSVEIQLQIMLNEHLHAEIMVKPTSVALVVHTIKLMPFSIQR